MNLTTALVTERRPLAAGRSILWLSAPEVSRGARPGQFLMIHPTGTLDPYLARPYWIHRVRDGEDGEELALLIDAAGPAGRALRQAVPGQRFRALGPLGRPLSPRPGVRNLLLVAEDIHVAPLVWCSDEETARGRSVTLLLGASNPDHLYPTDLLSPEVELVTVTAATAAGDEGVAALIPEYAGWADEIFACGTDALTTALALQLRRLVWRRPCRIGLHPPLPCGTGICRDCVVRTRRHGVKLVCRDGPFLDLRDLDL